ncbi:hypothetical protein [Desulfopila inferna]|uniref:hypothetical protein n=1 Tax=Desulfopila inferna TaxID=468528 RepID=UPI00196356C9|nr:hypothetical protein [Desulfopila inferna]MBM9604920.1 hypothetical protein [Desulfopila inferna]
MKTILNIMRLCIIAMLAFGVYGCDTSEEPMEETGEAIEDLGEAVEDSAEETGEAVEDSVDRAD